MLMLKKDLLLKTICSIIFGFRCRFLLFYQISTFYFPVCGKEIKKCMCRTHSNEQLFQHYSDSKA